MKSKINPEGRQRKQAMGTDLKSVPAGPEEKPVLQTDDPHGADLPDKPVGGQISNLPPEAASVATTEREAQ